MPDRSPSHSRNRYSPRRETLDTRERDDRSKHRRQSRSRDRRQYSRSRSRSRDRRSGDHDRQHHRSSSPYGRTRDDEKQRKADRLAKLQAWKQRQQPDAGEASAAANPVLLAGREFDRTEGKRAELPDEQNIGICVVSKEATRSSDQPFRNTTGAKTLPNLGSEDVDPLDAFMQAEVLPEVRAKEEQERREAKEEKQKLQELLKVRFLCFLLELLAC